MTPQETQQLLAWCARFDGRPPSKSTVEAWTAALHKDLTLGDAKQIVANHYGRTDRQVTVANINNAYTTLRGERLHQWPQAKWPLPPPNLSAEDYLVYQRAVVKALGNGANPEQAKHYALGHLQPEGTR